jgi:hypothetical protein
MAVRHQPVQSADLLLYNFSFNTVLEKVLFTDFPGFLDPRSMGMSSLEFELGPRCVLG